MKKAKKNKVTVVQVDCPVCGYGQVLLEMGTGNDVYCIPFQKPSVLTDLLVLYNLADGDTNDQGWRQSTSHTFTYIEDTGLSLSDNELVGCFLEIKDIHTDVIQSHTHNRIDCRIPTLGNKHPSTEPLSYRILKKLGSRSELTEHLWKRGKHVCLQCKSYYEV